MKFGRTETKDAVSSETSHGVSNTLKGAYFLVNST